MELSYTNCGKHCLPNITLPEQPQPTYGKYGRMRKRYLQEYRKVRYNELLLSGKLVEHLNDMEAQVQEYLARIVPEMAKRATLLTSGPVLFSVLKRRGLFSRAVPFP